ncbi:hypothetical protein SCP_0504010 [Sparassis crispa]|uniref:Uncharacterized protein n=1 Tax=Sparassis crispa TaxID=139825 RepID=A0A401GMA5_9APHY|nr:hypothetical protein SCP_0504010 [Sparassis crispa]GBE83353.1 hypothetical protein SCP_0504010 [Sparassis crispa]
MVSRVLDVQNTISKQLEINLQVYDVAEFLDNFLSSAENDAEMPNWSISKAFSRFQTLLGLLTVFGFDGIEYEDISDTGQLSSISLKLRDFKDGKDPAPFAAWSGSDIAYL